MIPIVFLSGPFRAGTHWEIEQNVRRAEQVALTLWKNGCVVVCPHLNTRNFYGELDEERVVDGYCELVRRSDAVVTLLRPAFYTEGMRREVEAARERAMPVFSYEDGELHLFWDWWRRAKKEADHEQIGKSG